MKVVLISTYELGHQPLGLAHPAAVLREQGFSVSCNDLAVEPLDEGAVRAADVIGVSVPMHTATRLGQRLAPRLRGLNPSAHLCFYGLYASLNAELLLESGGDSIIGGEFEPPLLALVQRLAEGDASAGAPLGVITARGGELALDRQRFSLPARDLLPPLERYAQLAVGDRRTLAGYVEASRGCAHRCRHCPLTPVYGGRLRIVQADTVLSDVRQLVELGAGHITFGDPDFFNGIRHSLRIVEALHAEFPGLTYDVTIKVEHLLEHRAYLADLARTGCLFIVSAVESVDDRVLAYLDKGHTAADVELALRLVDSAGLVLRPTLVAFTPWTTADGYVDLLRFVRERDLVDRIDPVQYAIRLLVPRGSSLLGVPDLHPFLGGFDPETLTYTWRHPDPRMDDLQRAVSHQVERCAREGLATSAVFDGIQQLTARAVGQEAHSVAVATRAGSPRPIPRLTEAWFC